MRSDKRKPTAQLVIIGGHKTRTIKVCASTSEQDIRRQLRPGERISYGVMAG